VHEWCLILEAFEVFIFILCFILTAAVRKLDRTTIIVAIIIMVAYVINLLQDLLVFMKPFSCAMVTPQLSFTEFVPQAIFFTLFAWVIFKLLLIWRVLKAETEEGAKSERRCMKRFSCFYYLAWYLFWIIERIFGYDILTKETNNKDSKYTGLSVILLIADAIVVFMEVSLFTYFIFCMCQVSVFLKAIQKQKLSDDEMRLVQHIRAVMTSFGWIVGIVMTSDTAWAVAAPYLWIFETQAQ